MMHKPSHICRSLSCGLTLASLALLLALTACGGSGSRVLPRGETQRSGGLSAPVLYEPDGQLRTASGPPAGIHLSWSRVGDPAVQGYYLYRDTQSIPLPPPDETINPALRVNAGNLILQPPSGTAVPFDDIFTPVLGTTYHYRVTTVDLGDVESYPSNEISYTVAAHAITGIAPLSVRYGDIVTISGTAFGSFNPGTDSVLFTAALGGSIAGGIISWQPAVIEVEVPSGAAGGPLSAMINGQAAISNESLTIIGPVITELDPPSQFVEQPLTIKGSGFGGAQGASTVSLAGQDLSAQVSAWSDTQITLVLPDGVPGGDVVVNVSGDDSNAVPFAPRAEILSISPPAALDGADVVLTGRYFGAAAGDVSASAGASAVVSVWENTAITLNISGAAAVYTLTVEPAAGMPSNTVQFEILGPLTVALGGVSGGDVLRATAPPQITIITASDAERVELLLDGSVVAFSTTAPFNDLALPLGATLNGQYSLSARAFRGAEEAQSAAVLVQVVSLEGDINGDGSVDEADVAALRLVMGLESSSPQFRAWFDTDGDGRITEADLSRVGYNFGLSL